jgi:branched-chain amino acid aminotransferase
MPATTTAKTRSKPNAESDSDPDARPDIAVERTTRPRPRPDAGDLRFGTVFTDHQLVCHHAEPDGWGQIRIQPAGPLALDPAAAGLHYGQTMFEGLKAFRGVDGKVRIFRLDRHCARMARGAPRLCMPALPPAVMHQAVLAFARIERDWVPEAPGTALYLRPTLIATEPFLGVRPARAYLFFVIASPVGGYFGGAADSAPSPLRLWVEEREVRAAPGGLGAVKAGGNYAASLHAAQAARAAGYDQVLWTDAREHRSIEEAGMMNVFVHLHDEIVTPPLAGTILAGVTRDAVITLLRRWGRPVRERRVTLDEILEARRVGQLHEIFATGTGASIASVGELGWRQERIVAGDGGEGPLARRLGPTLREIQTGARPDDDRWMTLVE